mgnify:CR=1 FL=1
MKKEQEEARLYCIAEDKRKAKEAEDKKKAEEAAVAANALRIQQEKDEWASVLKLEKQKEIDEEKEKELEAATAKKASELATLKKIEVYNKKVKD